MTYDSVIIGGGPAGLTAAIYLRRAGRSVLIIEKGAFGGQIIYSPLIENYPGYRAVSGIELADAMVEQALSLGADIEVGEVVEVLDGEIKTVRTEDGEYSAETVIIAVGARHRMLGVKNEENLIGKGVSFCAVCDGAFFKDKSVGVVGGGNSALQEAVMLSEICKNVTIIQNLPYLTGEKKLRNILEKKDNVNIICNSAVKELVGETELEKAVIETGGKEISLPFDGLFIAVGLAPDNEKFNNIVSLDENGYIDSDENCKTDISGIFTAGDCRRKFVRQVTTAVSDGACAAVAADRYLAETFDAN